MGAEQRLFDDPTQKLHLSPHKGNLMRTHNITLGFVDSKPDSIGTIVDADGWVLTKASVLDGKVSCRLSDQSVVVAGNRAESQEIDPETSSGSRNERFTPQ